jgi:hypothetical protein
MFGNLLGTVLGTNHILTTQYRAFWTLLSQGYRQELQQIIDHKRYIKPAHLLQSIQLVCYNWFSKRQAKLTPPTPDFVTILYNIVLNTYVLPNLPPTLYKLAYPKPSNPVPSLISTGSSNASTSTTPTQSSSMIGMSSVTTPTLPTVTTSQQGSHVANINPDSHLINMVDPSIKIRDLMGNDPPPFLDNGSQLCLSFLLRHGCWSSCHRANTHTHSLSAAEHARIVAYLKKQMQKLRANTSATGASVPGHSG